MANQTRPCFNCGCRAPEDQCEPFKEPDALRVWFCSNLECRKVCGRLKARKCLVPEDLQVFAEALPIDVPGLTESAA